MILLPNINILEKVDYINIPKICWIIVGASSDEKRYNHTAWSGIYRPPQDISFFSRSMCVMHARNAISRTCNYLDGTRNNRGFSLKLSDLRDATLVSPMLSFFPAAVTLWPIFKSWFRSIFDEIFWFFEKDF